MSVPGRSPTGRECQWWLGHASRAAFQAGKHTPCWSLFSRDNAAGYSFWTQAANLSFWGQPEAIFRQVYAGYKALSIPVASWEVDCNFIGETGFASGWCWRDWRTWNTTLARRGADDVLRVGLLCGQRPALRRLRVCQRQRLGQRVDRGCSSGFQLRDVLLAPVARCERLGHAAGLASVLLVLLCSCNTTHSFAQLFTDFLCFRGPELDGQLPQYFKASHVWLQGMILAATDAGLEVQLCMACPHQALESLDWPAVTNARANGDGGMFVPQLTYPALLAASLGIGWSKVRDRYRTSMSSAFYSLPLDPGLGRTTFVSRFSPKATRSSKRCSLRFLSALSACQTSSKGILPLRCLERASSRTYRWQCLSARRMGLF